MAVREVLVLFTILAGASAWLGEYACENVLGFGSRVDVEQCFQERFPEQMAEVFLRCARNSHVSRAYTVLQDYCQDGSFQDEVNTCMNQEPGVTLVTQNVAFRTLRACLDWISRSTPDVSSESNEDFGTAIRKRDISEYKVDVDEEAPKEGEKAEEGSTIGEEIVEVVTLIVTEAFVEPTEAPPVIVTEIVSLAEATVGDVINEIGNNEETGDNTGLDVQPNEVVDEIANDIPPAETTNENPPAEIANDTPPAEIANGTPPAEIANDTPPTEIANDITPAETANDIPPAEIASDIPPAEIANDTSSTEITNDIPAADIDNVPSQVDEEGEKDVNENVDKAEGDDDDDDDDDEIMDWVIDYDDEIMNWTIDDDDDEIVDFGNDEENTPSEESDKDNDIEDNPSEESDPDDDNNSANDDNNSSTNDDAIEDDFNFPEFDYPFDFFDEADEVGRSRGTINERYNVINFAIYVNKK